MSAGVVGWIALVAVSAIAFSWALACATPFVALAALAGTRMPRRHAPLLILATWLANQIIGFGVLGYPVTANAFAWGAVIGAAALLATGAALWSRSLVRRPALALPAAFGLAFLAYEGALYAATALLSSGTEAFSLPIVGRILAINLFALAGLVILHRGAAIAGLLVKQRPEVALPSAA